MKVSFKKGNIKINHKQGFYKKKKHKDYIITNIWVSIASYLPHFKKHGIDDVSFIIEEMKKEYDQRFLNTENLQWLEISKRLDLDREYYYNKIWEWFENSKHEQYYLLATKTEKNRTKYINKNLGSNLYTSEYWKQIRKDILFRDGYKCMQCGSNKNLQVHHIKYRHKSNSKKDLITLCKFCHAKKHKINGEKILRGK